MNQQQNIFPKERLHLNLARLKKQGETFEVVLEDVEKAYSLRQGKEEKIEEVISSEHIFFDAKKGNLASEEELEKIFGTSNPLEIAKTIIINGEINLTSEQRDKIFEAKKRKIISYIHRNGFDPKTKLPHPLQRIENAIEEAKVSINPEENFDYILEKTIGKIKTVLPISFEKLHIKATIPQKYAAKTYNAVKRKYSLIAESWKNNGSIYIELEIVSGEKENLFAIINKLTNGEAEIEESRKKE